MRISGTAVLFRSILCLIPLGVSACPGSRPVAAPPPTKILPALAEPVTVDEWIVLGPLPRWGRRPFAPSPVVRQLLLTPDAPPPREGDRVAWPRAGELEWRKLDAGGDTGRALGNGYAFATISSPGPSRAILEGKGTSIAWINGNPVTGDLYKKGRLRVPVRLREGENRILARAARGGLEIRLVPPEGLVDFNLRDVTLPDHREGEALDAWGAIPVLNTQNDWLLGAVIEAGGGHFERTVRRLPPLAPLGVCKVRFRIRCRGDSHLTSGEEESLDLPLVVRWNGGESGTAVQISSRQSGQTYRETFLSGVDGSVQYFAVRPPTKIDPDWTYALILSLHGAGVTGRGQADAYMSKDWAYVIAPTNRRSFGFDWEDWGRIDALEALAAARARYRIDPDRILLTGHSMGGHGVWHIGVTDPGEFAAIAPSAGWISFWSYGGGNLRKERDAMEAIFWRASSTSDTLSLLENLRGIPVFILHGEKDNNVPVREARRMEKRLAEFHDDFVYREFPGQGHWWGLPDTPGTDCIDLAEMWEHLHHRKRDPAPAHVYFATMDPGVSHRRAWVEILSQRRSHERSLVDARLDSLGRSIEMTTENVAALAIHPEGLVPRGPVKVRIDDEALEVEWGGRLSFVREGDAPWRLGPPSGMGTDKRPGRSGPFKRVFGRRFVMVVGTGGTDEENLAALRRARLDAQTWWYRANGRAEMVPDSAFDPSRYRGRNWILYGHTGMNSVMAAVAAAAPVRPEKGRVVVGEHRLEGGGLACLSIAPNPGDPDSLIGFVGGTDAAGIALSGMTSLIRSGIGYPDFCVWSEAVLELGIGGVRAAGFLDASWKVDPEDTVIRNN